MFSDGIVCFVGSSSVYSSSLFVPYPIDLAQFVRVDPWFQLTFLLGGLWCRYCGSSSDEKLIWEDNNVLVVTSSLVVVGSSRECIGSPVGRSLDMVDLDVVLSQFQHPSRDLSTDVLRFSPVLEVKVIGDDFHRYDRVG